MKNVMNIKENIKRILKEELLTESVSLPIKLSGSYQAPKGDGDALHSFDRRKSDHFGGYMLTGGPIPSNFSSKVKLDQGKGINQVLVELAKKGIKPDVKSISIRVNSDYTVEWEAVIDESTDGKAYVGVASRGSAGGGADSRAQGQLSGLKSKNPKFCNWTPVLDLNISKPIKIRQYFLKYTMCNPKELPNDIKVGGSGSGSGNGASSSKEKEFKSWEPGEYKIKGDEQWTYKLTKDKEWEAKLNNGSYTSLKSALSDSNYEIALGFLKLAKKL
jgi:hypothetical protein